MLHIFTIGVEMRTDGEKLKDFRNSIRLSQKELAIKLEVGLSSISMVESDNRTLSRNLKEKILNIFNYDIDKEQECFKKEVTSNIVPIPFYHVKAAANPKGEFILDYQESESLYFDLRWLKNVLGINPFNSSIIQAKGDSMDSGLNKQDDIKDGDLLLVDNSDLNIVNNRTYIFEINEELLVKKAVQDFNGSVTLYSNNEKYAPRILNEGDNAIVIGRVVWNGSKGNI